MPMTRSDDLNSVQMAIESQGISRRDFIRLNATLFVIAGTTACSRPDEAPDERTAFRILRTDDLMALHFRLQNLRIEHRHARPSRLVRINEHEEALLFVDFPGQHIAERAYGVFQDSEDVPVEVPAPALIAHPSRLAFTLPAHVQSMEFSLDKLLDWEAWEPRLANNGTDRQSTPSADQTLIEIPYGLVLSPIDKPFWSHARQPVHHAGRTELWHTSLLRTGSDGQVRVSILKPERATVTQEEGMFERALTVADRTDLYGKSASTRTLLLSPLGGWLDLRGHWQEGTIARWEHQATAGQDQRVVIQQQDGHLYPFGHVATLISVTEREVFAATKRDTDDLRSAAVLRKRTFLVIKEPEMHYSHEGMAFQSITASVFVTPALEVAEPQPPEMWVETRVGEPYRFRFSARDWAGKDVEFDAPAVFVSPGNGFFYENVSTLYEDPGYASNRVSELRGQAAVVARFEDPDNPEHDRWGEPLPNARSPGDCQLILLNLRFTGTNASPAEDTAPFTCQTLAMEARVPALAQFLSSDLNRGWFARRDPEAEDNLAELFAVALDSNSRIPLYLDKQSDRCGGLATPSFDVDGLSRVLGPVGDRESVSSDTGPMVWTNYLAEDPSTLLGSFSLIDLLSNSDGTPSLIVPRFEFTIEQKSIDEKSDDDNESGEESENEGEEGQEEEKTKNKSKAMYTEIGLSLNWSVPINNDVDSRIIALQPKREEKSKKSRMRLVIEAKSSKAINKPPASNDDASAKEQEKQSSVSWSVAARLTHFAIQLKVARNPLLTIGFEYLGVTLGPAQAEAETNSGEGTSNGLSEQASENSETDDNGDKKSKSGVSATIDHKISGIDASGALAYLQKMFDAASHLPKPPELLPDAPEPVSNVDYPAKLPGLGSADIGVNIGPFKVPEFKWLQFDVSNITLSVGLGFYFFSRKHEDETQLRIPDNEFSIRLADIDNPMTVVAEPWGGFATIGLNFTTRSITGFQASIGVLYRFTLDLKVTKAECEGSLAGVFTYIAAGRGEQLDVDDVDIVLKLSGQARLWIADIYLLIVAVGKWTQDYFAFRADVYLNIKLAFFTVPLHLSFETQSGASGGGARNASGAQELPDASRLTENEWLEYRRAYAAVV